MKRSKHNKPQLLQAGNNQFTPDQLRQIFFAKCMDPDHLSEWIKLFWGVNLPNTTVSRYSNCNPLESVWDVYNNCVHLQKGMDTLYIAPRGGGKCSLKGTNIIVKNRGLVPIENVQVDDLIWSGFAWRKVLQTFDEGEKEGVGVSTKNGLSLVGSLKHRVFTSSIQQGVEWKRIADLEVGDHIAISGVIPEVDVNHDDFKNGWLIGAITGDGCVLDTPKNKRVDFCAGDDLVANYYKELMLKKFNKVPREWQNSTNSKGYQVNSAALIEWFKSYVDGRLAYDKKLKTLTHSDHFLAGFLVGLFDTDGSHDEIVLANRALVDQVAQLLTRFSVFNRITYNRKKPRFSLFTNAEVSYHGVHFISSLPACLLPIGNKREKFKRFSDKRREQYRYPASSVEFFVKKLRMKYQLANGWMTIDGEKVRVKLPYANDISTRSGYIEGHKILAWAQWIAQYDTRLSDRLMVIYDLYFQKVDKLWHEPKAHFFDLSVEEDHSYVSNGIVSHNTLGVAITESMLMFHDKRGVVHVGAIEKQSKRAYSYFQNFVAKNKDILFPLVEKDTIEKTVLVVDNTQVSLECLPCTMTALNGPHEACENPNAIIELENGVKIPIKDVKPNDRVKSYNLHELSECIRVVNKVKVVNNHVYEITLSNGSKYQASAGHQLLTPSGWLAMEDLHVGKKVFSTSEQTIDVKLLPYNLPTPTVEDVLVGKLLGDAHLAFRGTSEIPRLSFAQSDKQNEYVNYTVDVLSKKYECSRYTKKSGFGSVMHSVVTHGSKDLSWLREVFFSDDRTVKGNLKKIIKPEIKKHLTPAAVAYWFMDDGSHSNAALTFATCSFTEQEAQILADGLNENFGLSAEVKMYVRGKSKRQMPTIVLYAADAVKLGRIMYPYVIPSMQYKLNRLFAEKAFRLSDGASRRVPARGFPKEEGHSYYDFRKWKAKIKNVSCLQVVDRRYLGIHETIQVEIANQQNGSLFDYSNSNYIINQGLISHNCIVMDELDTLQPEGRLAYKQINGIPVKHRLNGAPPVKIGISTRKSAYGLVQQQMDMAQEQGREVKMWNQIDLMEKCQQSRHGTKEVTIFVNQDVMHHIPEAEYNKLADNKKVDYVAHKGTDGCLKCPLFSVCLGDAKKQSTKMTTAASTMIATIDDVIKKVKGADVDWVMAELMCMKPSVEGIVFKEFDKTRHVTDWETMWTRLTGEPPKEDQIIDEQAFVREVHRRQVPVYAGIDWGWTSPSTLTVAAVDQDDNVYVLRSFGVTKTNDPTFIQMIKSKFHRFYRVQMYYPDNANGSGIDLMKTAGLPVAKVDKSENLGVQVIKRVMNIPGTSESKLFIAKENCAQLIHELERYHYEKDAAGNTIDGKFAAEYDHSIDGLRYMLVAVMGKARFVVSHDQGAGVDSAPLRTSDGSYMRAPNFYELAREHGISVEAPESKPFNRADDDEDAGPDGFTWGF